MRNIPKKIYWPISLSGNLPKISTIIGVKSLKNIPTKIGLTFVKKKKTESKNCHNNFFYKNTQLKL